MMAAPLSPSATLTLKGEQDMARRRGQRSGYLRADKGSWLLTYREYTWDPDLRKTLPKRKTVTIGPAPVGKKRKAGDLTKKQAERFAWDHYLAPLDNTTVRPFSTLTLNQFWEQRYKTHLERKRKYATCSQYKSIWKVWIQPELGQVRIFELKPDHVEVVIGQLLSAKKGTATVRHAKKIIGAMIEHARTLQMFTGENPAHLVELPQHVPVRRPRAMTIEQCRAWLDAVQDEHANPKDRRSNMKPLRTMSLLGICCSLGVSEQLGLRWGHVNLTDEAVMLGAEYLPAKSAAIAEHCYHGRRGSLKTGHRKRHVPLPDVLVQALKELRAAAQWSGPEDPVFAGSAGKPIWADNLAARRLKPAALALGTPWMSWHILRHTCATLTKSLGMMDVDRQALLGHSNATMTDHYTHEDWARMRGAVELLATEVTKPPKKSDPAPLAPAPATGRLLVMKRQAG